MLEKKYIVDVRNFVDRGLVLDTHETIGEFDTLAEALKCRNIERKKDRMGWSGSTFFLRDTNVKVVWRYVEQPHREHGQIKGRPEETKNNEEYELGLWEEEDLFVF